MDACDLTKGLNARMNCCCFSSDGVWTEKDLQTLTDFFHKHVSKDYCVCICHFSPMKIDALIYFFSLILSLSLTQVIKPPYTHQALAAFLQLFLIPRRALKSCIQIMQLQMVSDNYCSYRLACV